MSDIEHKALPLTELKFSDGGSGAFAGYASVFGVTDSYGDVVEKGAYKATLPEFLQHGFIAWSHDYAALPIAIPTEAKEDSRGLWVEAQFHSDEFAQRARKIAAERAAAGKSVGLSIGYAAKDSERDEKGLRHLKELDLFETSMVMLPANRDAGLLGIKTGQSVALKADEQPCCSHLFDLDVPFAELLAQLGGWTEHGASEAEALLARRAAEERKLSPEHLQAIRDYLVKAAAAHERLEQLIAEPEHGRGGWNFAFEVRRRRLQALEAL